MLWFGGAMRHWAAGTWSTHGGWSYLVEPARRSPQGTGAAQRIVQGGLAMA